MRLLRFWMCSGVSALCTFFLLSGNARAYIDPGTGSYILQIVIAGVVGAAFMLKLFWKRIQLFISNSVLKRKSRRENDPSGEDEQR